MKNLFTLVAAISLAAGAVAHAQTLDSPATPVSFAADANGINLPALESFAGASMPTPDGGAASDGGAALDAGTLREVSGLQLSRTNGHDPSWAKFASGTGNILFLSAGTLLPLIEDGADGKQHSLRTADALVVSTLLAAALKQVVHKKRPDGSDYKSFPSGHATAAFTVAAMQASFHPKQAIFWYAGAATIAASRVTLRRHYTNDVIAGAALGFASARLELAQNRGLLLRPFIRSAQPGNRVTGLSFSGAF